MVGAWISALPPIHAGMHKQPQRLVRSRLGSSIHRDRLTTLDGLGNLGSDWWDSWSSPQKQSSAEDPDAWWNTPDSVELDPTAFEEKKAESDYDWGEFVVNMTKALTPLAQTGLKIAFTNKKRAEGMSEQQIATMLSLGERRAAGVQAGTMGLPSGAMLGVGIAAIAVVGLILVMSKQRR